MARGELFLKESPPMLSMKKTPTSVTPLLLIVNAMRNEPESQLLRVSTPRMGPEAINNVSRGASAPFACQNA